MRRYLWGGAGVERFDKQAGEGETMSRKITGPVFGGESSATVPSFSGRWNVIKPHAEGRVNAMAEMAIHAMCLKSMGLVPESSPSFTGAQFQDFKAIPDSNVVRAHRAIFGLAMGGKNVTQFALNRPLLYELLRAPQARTDPLLASGNYSDRLLEIEAAVPTLKLLDRLLHRQRCGKPLEVNALVDIIPDMQKELISAHDRGIEKSEEILKRRGLNEVSLKDVLLNSGPKSPIVEEQIDFVLAKGGPSQFGELPQIILAASKEVTERHGNPTRSDVEQVAAQVQESGATVVSGEQ